MSNERSDRAIRRTADTYGFTLNDEAVESYATELDATAEVLGTLGATDPSDEPATALSEGDDAHNALRYTFSLSDGETGGGPLSGCRLGVKDNFAVAGVPMTCGSAALSYTPEYHATVVRRLLDAGGDVRATTNMDEFAFFTTGETCAHGAIENPAADGAVPGGSSSGSGAAIAAGRLDAALGSDTGGSVRIPASYCGVVGLKPTHRSVPRFGFVDLAPSLDHVGVLAESVALAADVFEVVAGPDGRDPSTIGMPTPDVTLPDAVDGDRVGVVEEAMDGADKDVREQVDAAVEGFEEAGVAVNRVSLPTFEAIPLALLATTKIEFARLFADNGLVFGTGTGYSEGLRAALATLDLDQLGDTVADQLVVGGGLLETAAGRHYVAAQRVRETFTREVDEALGAYDALVLPTTPTTAPPFGTVTNQAAFVQTISHTAPFNLTGHPALSVPCGTADDKPVGCQVVTARHDESTALALGSVAERSL
ncbi:amidase [Halobellus rarus]|uniref:Amidase n=1 Tax=Halobellus rarus TaxID=1126237 RepID=A0ABD6CSX9_9EURY|nr:amidase family protein [Halobellus rarus]